MKNKNIFGLMLAMVAGITSLVAQATLPAFWNCNDPASAPSGWTLNQGTTGTFVYICFARKEHTRGNPFGCNG